MLEEARSSTSSTIGAIPVPAKVGGARLQGWTVELSTKATMRKKLPGWKGYVAKRSRELFKCVTQGKVGSILPLLRDGADPNYQEPSSNMESLLHASVAYPEKKLASTMTDILLDAGASTYLLDRKKNTPLHTAAMEGDVETVTSLFEFGAQSSQENSDGELPLHIAAKRGDVDMLNVFVSYGAENSLTGCGVLPLHVAIDHRHFECAAILFRVEEALGLEHLRGVLQTIQPTRDEEKQFLAQLYRLRSTMCVSASLQSLYDQAMNSLLPGTQVVVETSDADERGTETQIQAGTQSIAAVETKTVHTLSGDDRSEKLRAMQRRRSSTNFIVWSTPHVITVLRSEQGKLGFSVMGGAETGGLPAISLREDVSPVYDTATTLNSGDLLLAINSVQVADMKHDDVIQLLRETSKVSLTVLPAAQLDPLARGNRRRSSSAVPDAQEPPARRSETESQWQETTRYDCTVPLTTREQREGEVDGVHYHFVTFQLFLFFVEDNRFDQWGEFNGNFYGTLKHTVVVKPKPKKMRNVGSTDFAAKVHQETRVSHVALRRNEQNVFGFVLDGGSEKNQLVFVRRVAKLNPVNTESTLGRGDAVLAINGTNIAGEPLRRAIELVSKCDDQLDLIVMSNDLSKDYTFKRERNAHLRKLSDRPSDQCFKLDESDEQPFVATEDTTKNASTDEADTKDLIVDTVYTGPEEKADGSEQSVPTEILADDVASGRSQSTAAKTGMASPPPVSIVRRRTQEQIASLDADETDDYQPVQMDDSHEDSTDADGIQDVDHEAEEASTASEHADLNLDDLTNSDIHGDLEGDDGETDDVTMDSSEAIGERLQQLKQQKLEQLKQAHNSLVEKIAENMANGGADLSDEFQAIQRVGAGKTTHIAKRNTDKNRYTNVLAYDDSRVQLEIQQGDEPCDYVNANFVPDHDGSFRYIATQGPTPTSTEAFWRLVWQQHCSLIVMVTNEIEGRRIKCHRYWPEPDSPQAPRAETFGALTVYYVSTQKSDCHTRREFVLKRQGCEEERRIVQLQYNSWPDHGVPKSANEFLLFRDDVRSELDEASESEPIIVHCSAGVGRSGTFISVDRILEKISALLSEEEVPSADDLTQVLDVFRTVSDMRQYRCLLVQTIEQYAFVHRAVDEAVRNLIEEMSAGIGASDA